MDTDVMFTPADVAALAGAADPEKTPLLSGIVPQLAADGLSMFPAVYRAETAGGKITRFTPNLDLSGDGIIKADACGAAFLLIHRGVLETIRGEAGGQPWFRKMAAPGGFIRGEDLSFCVRATRAGYPLHVHCGVRPAHLKTVMLTYPG